MRLPVIAGTIERRILVNYRVDPEVIVPLIPAPFRPQITQGYALAGICLIRLAGVRPWSFPGWLGLSSENAAHRIAVQWDTPAGVRHGVYVRRRDTNSWLNCLAGGRLFPGIHHHARFDVHETDRHFEVAMESDDGDTSLAVVADLADCWSAGSLFDSLDDASQFYAAGSLGYSATSDTGRFQGLELACGEWSVKPLAVREARSNVFDDEALFPPGTVEFDCALLMRNIEHEWHGREDLCCAERHATEDTAYNAAPSDSCPTSDRVSPIAAA